VPNSFQLATSDSDSVYPLVVINNMPASSSSNINVLNADMSVFSTKAILTTGGDLTPDPNAVIPAGAVPVVGTTVHAGDVQVIPLRYQAFLNTEGSKTYLYLYRQAYEYNGLIPYDSMFRGQSKTEYTVTNYPGLMSITGDPSLRVDQIDVTGITAAAASNNNPTTPTNPAAPTPPTQPTITTQSTSAPFAQTRTYTWSATAPNNGDILWGVNWGDTSAPTSTGTCPAIPPKGTGKNWTFTTQHTWDAPGIYTIKVYASDCVNPTTVFTLTVNIGNTTS